MVLRNGLVCDVAVPLMKGGTGAGQPVKIFGYLFQKRNPYVHHGRGQGQSRKSDQGAQAQDAVRRDAKGAQASTILRETQCQEETETTRSQPQETEVSPPIFSSMTRGALKGRTVRLMKDILHLFAQRHRSTQPTHSVYRFQIHHWP